MSLYIVIEPVGLVVEQRTDRDCTVGGLGIKQLGKHAKSADTLVISPLVVGIDHSFLDREVAHQGVVADILTVEVGHLTVAARSVMTPLHEVGQRAAKFFYHSQIIVLLYHDWLSWLMVCI